MGVVYEPPEKRSFREFSHLGDESVSVSQCLSEALSYLSPIAISLEQRSSHHSPPTRTRPSSLILLHHLPPLRRLLLEITLEDPGVFTGAHLAVHVRLLGSVIQRKSLNF